MKAKYRIAQIVEWNRSGQSCIALICGDKIVARYTNWDDARAAYKRIQS